MSSGQMLVKSSAKSSEVFKYKPNILWVYNIYPVVIETTDIVNR
jgi:hypothetical protein